MNNVVSKAQKYENELTSPCLTDTDLFTNMPGTPDARYSKIKRLIQSGRLIHLKRGLYIPEDQADTHPYAIAQHVYGPSYISFEAALSYHQLIPEAVITITSACTKRSKTFITPMGAFSYNRLPTNNFYVSVKLEKINDQAFFMATPWKAICDYIYYHKKNWLGLDPLFESLRIETSDLPNLDPIELDSLIEYYQNNRVTKFLLSIRGASK